MFQTCKQVGRSFDEVTAAVGDGYKLFQTCKQADRSFDVSCDNIKRLETPVFQTCKQADRSFDSGAADEHAKPIEVSNLQAGGSLFRRHRRAAGIRGKHVSNLQAGGSLFRLKRGWT